MKYRDRFTLRQIEEQIEKPTAELHQMCLEDARRSGAIPRDADQYNEYRSG